nr:XrtV sorting system accessory protein [Sphingomonas sp. BGYR3]
MLFLQRSTGQARAGDHPIRYLPPALGCALANWLGNEGHAVAAIAVGMLIIAYILAVLRPWPLDQIGKS